MTSTAGWTTPATVPSCKQCGKGRTVSGYQIAEQSGPQFLLRMYDAPNAPRELNRDRPWDGTDILGDGTRAGYHPGRSGSVTNVNHTQTMVTDQVQLTTEMGLAMTYTEWLVKFKCTAQAVGALPPCNQVPSTMP